MSAIATTLAIVAVATVTAGALALAGVGDDETDDPPSGSAGTREQCGRLQACNRDRLAICVKAIHVSNEVEPTAVSSEAALVDVARHPTWLSAGFANDPPPVVTSNCSVLPGAYDPRYSDDPPKSFFDIVGRRVSEPSKYSIYVFVIPDDDVMRLGGDPPFPLSSQEFQCSGDDCAVVTEGFYVSTDQARDVPYLTEWLEKSVGLERPF